MDDEPSVVEELRSIFRLEGFNVVTALSGEEGLERLREVPAKLVISDQKMGGGLSGTEFLSQVNALDGTIFTMMLTAFSEPEFVMEAVNRAKVFRYLLKPWNQKELIDQASSALQLFHEQAERRRLARANERLLARMARMESYSLFGDFSTALYERFFPVLQASLIADRPGGGDMAGEEIGPGPDEWAHLGTVVSRLGQVSTFYQLPSGSQPGALDGLVRGCVEEAKRYGDELTIDWHESYEEGLPAVMMQRHTLSIAIKALIENAVLFSRTTAEGHLAEGHQAAISIRVYKGDGAEPTVNVEVGDNGPGVRNAEKLFAPLYTTCPQRSAPWVRNRGLESYNFDRYNHVGLGLAIARWCITEHDGVLALVESGGDGRGGALFRVELPVEREGLR